MSFQDIKGQDKAIGLLREFMKQGRLASSYLFLGPEGIGKNLTAKTFAKALNCENNLSDSCDRCSSCLKMEKLTHPDLHFISPSLSSNTDKFEAIKIEDIRQLQRDINLKAYEAKKKIFIIDNAHNLTPEASNAMLKILEEPPPDSLIILISHKPSLLFKTIISRCQILKFYPLPREKLKEILKSNYGLDNHQAHFLAYFSEGRLGLALKLKDKDTLREKNRIIDEFGLYNRPHLEDSLTQSREELRRSLNLLSVWFRDIYLIKAGIPNSEIINLDRRTELIRLTKRYSFSDLDKILKSISDALLYLERNINIKLLYSWLLAGL